MWNSSIEIEDLKFGKDLSLLVRFIMEEPIRNLDKMEMSPCSVASILSRFDCSDEETTTGRSASTKYRPSYPSRIHIDKGGVIDGESNYLGVCTKAKFF